MPVVCSELTPYQPPINVDGKTYTWIIDCTDPDGNIVELVEPPLVSGFLSNPNWFSYTTESIGNDLRINVTVDAALAPPADYKISISAHDVDSFGNELNPPVVHEACIHILKRIPLTYVLASPGAYSNSGQDLWRLRTEDPFNTYWENIPWPFPGYAMAGLGIDVVNQRVVFCGDNQNNQAIGYCDYDGGNPVINAIGGGWIQHFCNFDEHLKGFWVATDNGARLIGQDGNAITSVFEVGESSPTQFASDPLDKKIVVNTQNNVNIFEGDSVNGGQMSVWGYFYDVWAYQCALDYERGFFFVNYSNGELTRWSQFGSSVNMRSYFGAGNPACRGVGLDRIEGDIYCMVGGKLTRTEYAQYNPDFLEELSPVLPDEVSQGSHLAIAFES